MAAALMLLPLRGSVVVAACLGTLVTVFPATALSEQQDQPPLPPDVKDLIFNPGPVTATPATMIESAHRTSETIRQIVGRRLVTEPVTPALLVAVDPAGAALTVHPAADVVGTEAVAETTGDPLLWNIWVDLTTGYTDDDDPVSGFEGPLTIVSVGGDRKIGDRGVVGLMGNFETSDYDTTAGPGTLDSEAVGLGGYVGVALSDQVVADASLLWKDVDNVTSFRALRAEFDSERWQAAANLTGYFYSGSWRFSPTAGLTWSREDQEAYTDPTRTLVAPDQEITTRTVSAGIQVGHTIVLDNGRSVEPWLGVAVEWNDVELDPAPPAGSPSADDEYADVRLSGGLNSQLGERLSLALKGEVSGLARHDYLSATVGGQVAVRF